MFNYLIDKMIKMSVLDDLEKIKEVDKENLADLMSKMPEQIEMVWQDRDKINPPVGKERIKNVVIAGMGCDRVTAEVIKKILAETSSLPIEVVGDYKTAFYFNKETLVVALSYSGQTPEILSFVRELLKLKNKPKIFAIVGGGELEEIAKKEKITFYKFSGTGPSRANIGYLFAALFILLQEVGLIKNFDFFSLIKVARDFNSLLEPEKKTEENKAKHLAYQIFDRLPIIVGAEHLWPVAQRWKKELNENAKTFSFAEEAPEFFHNTVVGISYPWRIKDEALFIFLESNLYEEKIKKALSIFKKILVEEKINFETINYAGKNRLEEIMTSIILGDWLSFYLAILNKVNPTPVKNIDLIKKEIQ